MISTYMSYLKQEVLVRNVELKSYRQLEDFRKVKGERRLQLIHPTNLLESFSLESLWAE